MSGPTSSRARFHIVGGNPISGSLRPRGNKNAALPLLAATLLTEETVTLRNLPDIADVRAMVSILEGLDVSVEHSAEDADNSQSTISFEARNINGHQPDPELCRSIRASVLLAGPLLGRRGHVTLSPPGGDVIGRRRLDTHVLALEALGASLSQPGQELRFEAPGRLHGADIFLDEPSVTGTENAIMAAVLAKGHTTISNAASEPHIQDLCHLLVAMGAEIDGIASNCLNIEGKESLHGADYELGPDYIEVGSMITLAAVTGGELRLLEARPQEHRATKLAFAKLGIEFVGDGNDIVVPGEQELQVRPDLGGAIPKIEDAPWPGFPADLTSIAVVAATQSQGTSMIHEKMFESRLFFVDRLVSMGAQIVLCDPHRVVVSGRSQLLPQELISPDIRAGMAMLIAALCADGESVIHNVQQIDRGYERIDERLRSLGADIRRERD